jgi:hypothetical protein
VRGASSVVVGPPGAMLACGGDAWGGGERVCLWWEVCVGHERVRWMLLLSGRTPSLPLSRPNNSRINYLVTLLSWLYS